MIRYMLQDYIRTYSFVPPVLLFIIWTIVSYTYVPNPVFDSFAIACAALYLIVAWLAITLMDTEELVQQQITMLHANSYVKVFSAKILSILFLAALLSLFAVIYPLIIGAFNRSVTVLDCFIAFMSLILISLLSISIAVFFSRAFHSRTLSSWLLLALILVVSLVRSGIENVLPDSFALVTWVLPPSFMILDILGEETIKLGPITLLKWLYVIAYSVLLFYIFLKVKVRKGLY